MNFIFMVEEISMEAALMNLLPKMLGASATFKVHPFQGKSNLLANLEARLRAYAKWLPDDNWIIVLIDADGDCVKAKASLEQIARNAGLATRTSQGKESNYQVVNRIAVEELEAWFFGDVSAMIAAFPRIPSTVGRRERYRNPDAIRGGTWESLERLMQKQGYYKGGLPKTEVARKISEHMDPDRNTSRSFQVFRDALRALISKSTPDSGTVHP